jgi:hypothetical protein
MHLMQPFSLRGFWIASALAAIVLTWTVAGSAATTTATLKVTHHVDASGPLYIEGAIYYLRAARNGRAVTRTLRQPATTLRLAAGRYRLTSWARPCDGNCGYLDPPTDRCSAAVRVRANRTTRIRVTARAGSPCRIAVLAAH